MNCKMMNFLRTDAMKARMKSLLRKSSVWLLVVVLLIGRPGPAHAQFGIDLGVIEAGLQAILSVLKSSVGDLSKISRRSRGVGRSSSRPPSIRNRPFFRRRTQWRASHSPCSR